MRTVFMALVLIWSLIQTLPGLWKALRLRDAGRTHELRELVAFEGRRWGRLLVWGTGSTVEVIGAEKLPMEEPIVVVANHQGNFDIPLVMGYLGRPVSYIAKEELQRTPVLGKWLELSGSVFIKRGNPREALKAIQLGAERVKEGVSMAIFPEGSRSRSGRLLPFKPGAMKLAQKSGARIVPVTIVNTCHIMTKKSLRIRKSHIQLIFGDPIDPNQEHSVDLAELIREQIQRNLDRYQRYIDEPDAEKTEPVSE